MRLSLALCTLNGAAYLHDQWQSILRQTRLPDEVIVCDDGSEDATLQLLQAFAKTAPFPVRIQRNTQRLGPARNFGAASALCTGDIIAWCDQDDVWLPQKLERLAAAFARRPELGLAFCDARIVDEHLQPRGDRQWQSAGFSSREQRLAAQGGLFSVLLRHNVVTGAAMAWSSRLRDLVLPVEQPSIHDEWAALLISAVAPYEMMDEPLMDYRQHAGQQIGGPRNTLWRQVCTAARLGTMAYERELLKYQTVLTRLHRCEHYGVPESCLRQLDRRVAHTQRRVDLRQRRRPRLGALLEACRGDYGRFGYGWKSLAQDLVL